MFYIGLKKLCVALVAWLIVGCTATLTAPELGSGHPANPAATESAMPILSPTLKSYRTSTTTAPSDTPGRKDDMQGMDHSQHGTAKQTAAKEDHGDHGASHGSGGSAAGKPGNASMPTRDIQIVTLDAMRFDPNSVRVKAGETIRFVVTNAGQVQHEFVIGDPKEQEEHAEMMRKMPSMKHADNNMLTLTPGETKALLWEFDKGGEFEIACHVPGHYEAGMRGKVSVIGTSASPEKERAVEEDDHDDHKH